MRVEELFEHFATTYEADSKLNTFAIEMGNSFVTPNEERELRAMMKRVRSHIDRKSFGAARTAFNRLLERGHEYGVETSLKPFF